MEHTITDKLWLFLANWFDFNSRFCWKNIGAMPDDPRLHYNRRWIEKCIKNQKERKKLHDAFQSLKRNEFLQEKILGNSKGYILSPKGKIKILRLKIKQLDKKKLKNKNWLMVLFDIPEKLRKTRDVFRRLLHELGFEQLQKSVWVTPYDVLNELKEAIENCQLEKYAKFLLIKEIKK